MHFRQIFISLVLILCGVSLSFAQTRQSGAWSIGVIAGNEGLYAATANDSNAIFGQYCYQSDASCYWLLANDIDCEAGSKYPVLVNADAGASSLEIFCMKINGKARYAFTSFSTIADIVKNSSRIGIAFPMKNGFFQVNRFSLDGAEVAVARMREATNELVKKSTGTKDRTL